MQYWSSSRESLRAFRLTFAAAAAGFLLFQFVPPFQAKAAPAPKVEICHIPPGNPANAHTISVSGNAIKSHLKHGDYLGACQLQCEDACDDGNPCTIDECNAGECDHSPVSCNDGNQCTADSCNAETGGCDNFALPGQTCTGQDGSACTLDTGLCNAAADCELTAIPDCCESDADCADEDLCTFEVCTSNACVSDGTAFCAPDDACEQTGCDPDTGLCVDVPVVCDPPGPCETGGYCDPTAGCVYAPIPGCCLDDSGCNDNDPCTADACIDNACEHEVCHDPVSACDQYETCDDNCIPIITGPTDCSDGTLCTDDECDPVDGCLNPPTSCDDGFSCTVDSCDPQSGCASTPSDSACDDGNVCTQDECDPLSLSLDGCRHDPIPGCCNADSDCAPGEVCNTTGSSPICEPAPPTCFSAVDYQGTGDRGGLRADCELNGGCADIRQCGRASSSDTFQCVDLGDPAACARLDAFYASAGGCNICEDPPPGPSECPCWDGGPQSVPGISNLNELWQAYAPASCSLEDSCRDTAQPYVEITSADCYSPSNDMITRVLRNTNPTNPAVNGEECRVYVRDAGVDLTLSFPVGSPEGAACLAEHQAFTPVDPPPVPPGGTNVADPCFLANQ